MVVILGFRGKKERKGKLMGLRRHHGGPTTRHLLLWFTRTRVAADDDDDGGCGVTVKVYN
ncbi:hypothetical protein HanRHA438_Chr09g0386171 [Helianthus annuus]|nr:hypothetical protein HanIR_Chr09g0403651 [Helianthus annuus]KAJ0541398.1 hypothetical protein HanHA89_Chr09g0328001 [Helianthus annuus]KAJ0706478.1 hypothetical protein HanLR1_Chr09g0307481 [Helianthus annuus]KAJ0752426.1 hypothetical protein HanPI659440_Chr09g0324211 [Helianthus annuus]KAJ0887033.1 hypothetical protein HanRHA438_Chr09g0386171 [Helianthus annuus]